MKRHFLMNQASEGGTGGGQAALDPNGTNQSQQNSGGKSQSGGAPFELSKALWGEMNPKFPEGLEDELKNDASIKPFFSKEGDVNVANLIKSYIHTKKSVGTNKVSVPNENSTAEEVEEFWSKVGWKKDAKEFTLKHDKEKSNVDAGFVEALTKFAHENKLPISTAQKVLDFADGQVKVQLDEDGKRRTTEIAEGVDKLKTKYGQVYNHRVEQTKRMLKEVVKDAEILKSFSNPDIGSNPVVMETLFKVAEKLYAEDKFTGTGGETLLSPSDAEREINKVYGDKSHPFHKPNHPGHKQAQADMLRLFEMKRVRV